MLATTDKIFRALFQGCGILAALSIVMIGVLVLVNIISRSLGLFVPGMTEGAGYCMAAAGSLGLAYTFGEHGHIRVSMVVGRLRGRARFAIELWALGLAASLACYLGYYLLRMVYVSYLFEDRSDGSDELLIWIPQAPMAFGFAVFGVSLVHAVVIGLARGDLGQDAGSDVGSDPGKSAGH